MNPPANVVGAVTEYAYHGNKIQVVGGLRGDYHNTFGFFATPRLHVKYNASERTALRLSAGRGQRTPYVLIDNAQYLVSSRQIQFQNDFAPEVAWNYGASYTQNFEIKNWEMGLSVDYYYTDFENQTVIDVEDPRTVTYYNLEGESYSHAAQGEISATYNSFDLKAAYKYLDVKTQYRSGLKQVPYLPQNRVLLNAAYATRFDKWKFDVTALWTGVSRVPSTESNPEPLQRGTSSEDFWRFNAQINKKFRLFSVYVGVENLLDYRQQNPIIDSENPFGDYFDASMVWGPVFGRNIYAGFKMKIK
jgi:outer membrane receptor for ferrienterochelin and colicin